MYASQVVVDSGGADCPVPCLLAGRCDILGLSPPRTLAPTACCRVLTKSSLCAASPWPISFGISWRRHFGSSRPL